MSNALAAFFGAFPIPFHDEHIHLTGSLGADLIYPRLAALLDGPDRALHEARIAEGYGADTLPIRSQADVEKFIRMPQVS